ncbi:hypothetical protein NLG97_g3342 [Lecanicillium saksenae]|uniref:Uncharacterized protein n=1 Tax=Lecanicillium saksenae TaxID=468837 RepID=A0ACC1R028_9HYPO|nr:hypothetical protein NLG97_g3342 [Lecanicillium saksenae]
MKGCFSALPAELLEMIMRASATLKDLANLILASRDCYRIFSASPNPFILASLKSSVPGPLWSEFCAASFARSNFQRVLHARMPPYEDEDDYGYSSEDDELFSQDRAKVLSFLHQYFTASHEFEIQASSTDDLRIALQLNRHIGYLLDDYVQRILRDTYRLCQLTPHEKMLQHANIDPAQRQDIRTFSFIADLSIAERTRLYRGFLCFEIYARVFRPRQSIHEIGGHDRGERFEFFIKRLKPWEVEEIACVHQYLSDIIRAAYLDLEHEYEREARRLDRLFREEQRQLSRHGVFYTGDLPLLPDFYCLSSSESHEWRYDGRETIAEKCSSIVGSGLAYMYQFSRSDRSVRFEHLLRNHPVRSDFLYATLPHNTILPIPASSSDYRDLTQASAGYMAYGGAPPDLSYSLYLGSRANVEFRAFGYVFWDAEKLGSEYLQHAFRHACSAGYRGTRRDAGWYIRNVALPPAYWDYICNKFCNSYEIDDHGPRMD